MQWLICYWVNQCLVRGIGGMSFALTWVTPFEEGWGRGHARGPSIQGPLRSRYQENVVCTPQTGKDLKNHLQPGYCTIRGEFILSIPLSFSRQIWMFQVHNTSNSKNGGRGKTLNISPFSIPVFCLSLPKNKKGWEGWLPLSPGCDAYAKFSKSFIKVSDPYWTLILLRRLTSRLPKFQLYSCDIHNNIWFTVGFLII